MNAPRRSRGSLRLNLMIWLVVPLGAILMISLWLSYGSAFRQATLVTDGQLTASARMIAEQVQFSDGSLSVTIPPSALELFASDSHDEIAYRVTGPDGTLIAGYPDLESATTELPDFGFGYYPTQFRTESMRAIMIRQPVITPRGSVSITVAVGETLKARDRLMMSLWVRGFFEQAMLLVAGALFIWIGISIELRPLLRLRQAVRDRPEGLFEPFDSGVVQSEVRPLVEAINGYMERLESHLTRQRRFLETAAHQLRTPLALMKTQIGYALRSGEASEVADVLKQVDANLTSLSRLTSQLLTLGHVEHDRAALQTERVNLADLARQVVTGIAPRALDRGIELAFISGGDCPVDATPTLTHELVRNLVDNIVEHAGAGATGTVSVHPIGAWVVLRVEDDGVGVGDQDRPHLFERFHRGKSASAGGSGLGLSIIGEIAGMFGGRVELPGLSDAKGFCVVVHLPLATSR